MVGLLQTNTTESWRAGSVTRETINCRSVEWKEVFNARVDATMKVFNVQIINHSCLAVLSRSKDTSAVAAVRGIRAVKQIAIPVKEDVRGANEMCVVVKGCGGKARGSDQSY